MSHWWLQDKNRSSRFFIIIIITWYCFYNMTLFCKDMWSTLQTSLFFLSLEKIILGGILLSCVVNKQHMHKCIFSFWRSSTYKSQGIDVTVKYSQGSWTGVLGTDVITIPKGIDGSYTINIATIFESENFFLPGVQWHGILGLAYGTLAKVNDPFSCFYHLQWW